MSRRLKTTDWLLILVAVGALVRVAAWSSKGGFHYPDEIFQQLDPAHFLRTGVAWLPWEFDRGLRSWLLPWLYAGMMEALSWVGVEGLDALRAINLHNALLSVAVVPAAFRMGRALCHGDEGEGDRWGLAAAAAAAAAPPLLYFAPHALSGSTSLVCLCWGWTFWLEARRGEDGARRALVWAGCFFGLAASMRFTTTLYMTVPALDLAARSRGRDLHLLVLGAAPPLAVLGAVDALSWGTPFHSIIEHFTYNFLEDGASEHGVSPWHFYLTTATAARLGPGLIPAACLMALGARRSWPLLASAAVPFVLLSTIPHKEERFIMHQWPLLAVAMAIGAAVFWRSCARRGFRAPTLGCAILASVILISSFIGVAELPWRWRAGLFEAQDYVGRQSDATGLVFDDRQHLNGGYLCLNRNIPQVEFSPGRLENPLYNYAALASDTIPVALLLNRGWEEAATFEAFVVLRKPASPRVPPPAKP